MPCNGKPTRRVANGRERSSKLFITAAALAAVAAAVVARVEVSQSLAVARMHDLHIVSQLL